MMKRIVSVCFFTIGAVESKVRFWHVLVYFLQGSLRHNIKVVLQAMSSCCMLMATTDTTLRRVLLSSNVAWVESLLSLSVSLLSVKPLTLFASLP